MLAPIMITVFNRAKHTEDVLNALSRNELASKSDLYVYSDGPRKESDYEKVRAVRKVLGRIKGFKNIHIIKSEKNKGLANSVITGVTDIVNKYGKIIVLEDDLLTHKYFLNVMNQMLDYYEEDTRVGSVTAFMQSTRQVKLPKTFDEEIFFNVRPSSTGWGTWKNRWNLVDWSVSDYESFKNDINQQRKFNLGGADLTKMLNAQMEGNIDSWAIRWAYHFSRNNLISVQTTKSYIDNIGYDSSGVHSKDETYFFRQEEMAEKKTLQLKPFKGDVDWDIVKRYRAPNAFSWVYIKKKLLSKFGILIKF